MLVHTNCSQIHGPFISTVEKQNSFARMKSADESARDEEKRMFEVW